MYRYSLHTALKHATITLGALSSVLIGYGFVRDADSSLQALFFNVGQRSHPEWVTITSQEVLSGAMIPASTNVIIHIPEEISRITRKTLFGRSGEHVRYWGYCFPPTNKEAYTNTKSGFPGYLFLSEAEREYRDQQYRQQLRNGFSVYRNLTEEDLNETRSAPQSAIRHEMEIFYGGTSCYIMTSESIPVGADVDNDLLNSALERANDTDPHNPDTDGDGIMDGAEVLIPPRTQPTKRDSDGDGIIDGIEDANRNGRFDKGETNPTEWDTDRDGLCDGICKINHGKDIRGEDKNLNGIYEPDSNEYDPRSVDSDGDGVLDEHEVYLCVLAGGDDC